MWGTQLEFLPDCTQAGLPNRLTALLILLSGRENKRPRGGQGSGSHHFIPMVLGKGFGGRVGQGGQLPVCPFESPVPQTRLAPCVAALRGPGPFLPPPHHLLLPPTPTCTQSHTHTPTSQFLSSLSSFLLGHQSVPLVAISSLSVYPLWLFPSFLYADSIPSASFFCFPFSF